MKRSILSMGVLLCLWVGSYAQKASPHSDINSSNTISNTFRPQLSYPEDKSLVEVPNPVFIWLPPPTPGGTLIMYSIRLVKMQSGQTPQEALLQNPPLVNLEGLTNNFLSYPSDAPALDNGAQYAWQVAASSAGKSLGEADISTFSVVHRTDQKSQEEPELFSPNKQKSDSSTKQNKKNSQTANIAQNPNKKQTNVFDVYPVASVVSDGHFYLTNGTFKFAYINKANDKTLTYTIRRLDKNENLSSLPKLSINPGTNKLVINLEHNGEMEQGKYYDLEITDSKGQVYKLLYYYITQ